MACLLAPQIVQNLRQQIGRLEQGGCNQAEKAVLPFGLAEIDSHMTSGGLALGALHEISGGPHPAHDAAMLLFVGGLLARLEGSILWCIKRSDLFAPALEDVGVAGHHRLRSSVWW